MSLRASFSSSLPLKQRLLNLFLILTAPGVMIHELAHQLICIAERIPLGDVVYFQLDSPVGYVEHGTPRTWWQAFSLAAAPLFINLFIAVWLFVIPLTILSGGVGTIVFSSVLLWLGFSAVVHSLPSPQDARNLWTFTLNRFWRWPLLIIAGPIYGLILLVYKTGLNYVSIPLALATLAATGIIFGVSIEAVVECVLQGQWGCWDSQSVLELTGFSVSPNPDFSIPS